MKETPEEDAQWVRNKTGRFSFFQRFSEDRFPGIAGHLRRGPDCHERCGAHHSRPAAFGAYTLMQFVETLRPGKYSIFRLSHDAQMHPLDGPNGDGHLTNDYLAVPPGRLCEIRAFAAVEAS